MTGREETTDEVDYTNLIVNYLPKTMDHHQLKALFEEHGTIVFYKVVRNRVTKQSECYGFVRYDNAESASEAIAAKNGYIVDGKRLRVAVAVPPSKGPDRANLYLAGFPAEWKNGDLRNLLSPFGTVVDARVLVNFQTQQSKQCGFVRMETNKEAVEAIKALNGVHQEESGKLLTVRFADKPRESAARKQMKNMQTLNNMPAAALAMGYPHPEALQAMGMEAVAKEKFNYNGLMKANENSYKVSQGAMSGPIWRPQNQQAVSQGIPQGIYEAQPYNF